MVLTAPSEVLRIKHQEGRLHRSLRKKRRPNKTSLKNVRPLICLYKLKLHNSLPCPLLLQSAHAASLDQQLRPDAAPCRQSTVLYHGAEGRIRRHGGGGVAICRGVGPHQKGAAIYGVLPLLRQRCRV